MPEIRIYRSLFKALQGLVFFVLGFGVWIFLLLLESPGTADYVVSCIITFIFGITVLVGIWQVFNRRPVVIISVNGVWYKQFGEDVIKWEQIAWVSQGQLRSAHYLSFHTNDTHVSKRRKVLGVFKVGGKTGSKQFDIYLNLIDVNKDELFKLINKLYEMPKSQRHIIIQKSRLYK